MRTWGVSLWVGVVLVNVEAGDGDDDGGGVSDDKSKKDVVGCGDEGK